MNKGKLPETLQAKLRASLVVDTTLLNPESREDLLEVLTHPERAPLLPREAVVDWLLRWYKDASLEQRGRLSENIVHLLMEPGRLAGEASGEAFRRAMDLVRRARLLEAVPPLQKIAESRELARYNPEAPDLHGRALIALNALGGLSPSQCLETELRYLDFAPLAFAFVRDKEKSQIAGFLPRIALLDFFPEALDTVMEIYPDEYREILMKACRLALEQGNRSVIAAFLGALNGLELEPSEKKRLAEIFTAGDAPGWRMPEVLLDLEDPELYEEIVGYLQGENVLVHRLSNEILREARQPLVVTMGVKEREARPRDARKQPPADWVEVFFEGQARWSGLSRAIQVPHRLAGAKKAGRYIGERIIQIGRERCELQRLERRPSFGFRHSPPPPSSAILEAVTTRRW